MRSRILSAVLLGGTLVLTAACATSEEWAEWRGHPTHYATGQHLAFSWRNREGAPTKVTRRDIEASRADSWWGKVITVNPDQVFQN